MLRRPVMTRRRRSTARRSRTACTPRDSEQSRGHVRAAPSRGSRCAGPSPARSPGSGRSTRSVAYSGERWRCGSGLTRNHRTTLVTREGCEPTRSSAPSGCSRILRIALGACARPRSGRAGASSRTRRSAPCRCAARDTRRRSGWPGAGRCSRDRGRCRRRMESLHGSDRHGPAPSRIEPVLPRPRGEARGLSRWPRSHSSTNRLYLA